jgi:hypothetical protein
MANQQGVMIERAPGSCTPKPFLAEFYNNEVTLGCFTMAVTIAEL